MHDANPQAFFFAVLNGPRPFLWNNRPATVAQIDADTTRRDNLSSRPYLCWDENETPLDAIPGYPPAAAKAVRSETLHKAPGTGPKATSPFAATDQGAAREKPKGKARTRPAQKSLW